jgi:hypothetical protein
MDEVPSRQSLGRVLAVHHQRAWSVDEPATLEVQCERATVVIPYYSNSITDPYGQAELLTMKNNSQFITWEQTQNCWRILRKEEKNSQ